jgi:hypothetical protein
MRGFKDWLAEQNNNVKFAAWNSHGEITVYLRGIRYRFLTDTMYHDRWKAQARRNPALVMSQINQQVRTGKATQLEPTPINPTNKPNPHQHDQQPKLFDKHD